MKHANIYIPKSSSKSCASYHKGYQNSNYLPIAETFQIYHSFELFHRIRKHSSDFTAQYRL